MDEDDVKVTENDLPQEFILKLLGQHEARGLWGIKHTREPVDFMVKHAKTHELSLPIVQLIITKEGIFMTPIVKKTVINGQDGGGDGAKEGKNETIRKMIERHHSEKSFVLNLRTRSNEIHKTTDRGQKIKQNNPISNLIKGFKESGGNFKRENLRGKNNNNNLTVNNNNNNKKKKKDDVSTYVVKPATNLQLLEKFSIFDWKTTGIFFFGIDTISYGVQDLIFTRVFSMIVVLDRHMKIMTGAKTSFLCYAFVCESRNTAKRVTHALAAAFQVSKASDPLIKKTHFLT